MKTKNKFNSYDNVNYIKSTKSPNLISVLNTMEQNFNSNQVNVSLPVQTQNTNTESNNSSQNFSGINKLMPLISALSNKNASPVDIVQMVNKNSGNLMSNNPMLSQLMSILPNLSKMKTLSKKPKKEDVKIDSLIKANEYKIESEKNSRID